jgi:hypothetical protein
MSALSLVTNGLTSHDEPGMTVRGSGSDECLTLVQSPTRQMVQVD